MFSNRYDYVKKLIDYEKKKFKELEERIKKR
jgi:hypothetical protein